MTVVRKYWLLSASVSFLLALILIAQWVYMNNYTLDDPQLPTIESAMQSIEEEWSNTSAAKQETLRFIKTGVYIQSLQFFNSSDVNVTGYIWQKYDCDQNSENGQTIVVQTLSDCTNKTTPIPTESEVGFILPEQVYSGSDISPQEVYRTLSKTKDWMVIGWYFEATLRQPFEYRPYPFDHKTVWIRLWPKAFFSNVVLIPDYEAYESTGLEDTFGIEKTIVLGTWEREDTYFDYAFTKYDTNFGIDRYIGQTHFPELRYNFVVKRKFGNAFIIYLLPLYLVAALLFAAMLTITDDKTLASKIGFNTSGFIGASSALFFVVMLAHIQLREQFAGSGIVYIEYFYIIMYAFLVLATANAYLFSLHSKVLNGILLWHDNLIPKVCYWPVLIGLLILVTSAIIWQTKGKNCPPQHNGEFSVANEMNVDCSVDRHYLSSPDS